MKRGFRIALIAAPVAAVSANYARNAMLLEGVCQWRIVVKVSLLMALSMIGISLMLGMGKAMKAGALLTFWRHAIALAFTGLLILVAKFCFVL